MALGKKTGGRTKGTVNKSVQEVLDKAKAKGITPLDYMLEVLNNKKKEYTETERMDAAKNAAPYIHRKQPQAIENTDMNKLEGKSVEELENKLKELQKGKG